MKNITNTSIFWQAVSLIFLILFIVTQTFPLVRHTSFSSGDQKVSVIGTIHASEIYPMFSCPCCGQPLNKENPCCGSMTAMIDFIDNQIALGAGKDEVVLTTAKEYGIERLLKAEDRLALKQKLASLVPPNAPKIELNEESRDLGRVSQKQGVVTADFEFANAGESELIINKLSSSCSCTSGAIVYDGAAGPKFTMEGHGQENPGDWEVAIKSGDTAILRVYYDPTVHADLVGPVTRTVSIMSNDPVEFEKQVTITLEQTK